MIDQCNDVLNYAVTDVMKACGALGGEMVNVNHP